MRKEVSGSLTSVQTGFIPHDLFSQIRMHIFQRRQKIQISKLEEAMNSVTKYSLDTRNNHHPVETKTHTMTRRRPRASPSHNINISSHPHYNEIYATSSDNDEEEEHYIYESRGPSGSFNNRGGNQRRHQDAAAGGNGGASGRRGASTHHHQDSSSLKPTNLNYIFENESPKSQHGGSPGGNTEANATHHQYPDTRNRTTSFSSAAAAAVASRKSSQQQHAKRTSHHSSTGHNRKRLSSDSQHHHMSKRLSGTRDPAHKLSSSTTNQLQIIRMKFNVKRYRFCNCILILLTSCLLFLIAFCVLFRFCLQRVYIGLDQLQLEESSIFRGFAYNVTLFAWNPNVQPLNVDHAFFNISIFKLTTPDQVHFVDAFEATNISRIHMPDADMDSSTGIVKSIQSIPRRVHTEGSQPGISTNPTAFTSSRVIEATTQLGSGDWKSYFALTRNIWNQRRALLSYMGKTLWNDFYSLFASICGHPVKRGGSLRSITLSGVQSFRSMEQETDDDSLSDPVSEGSTGRFSVSHSLSSEELQQREDYAQLFFLLTGNQASVGYHIYAKVRVNYGWISSVFTLEKTQVYFAPSA